MNKEIIGVIDSLFYFLKISYIWKQQWCLSVCGDKQGRGRAGRPGQTPAH
jgi:hypothetical protein